MASKTTLNAKNLETLGAERLAELLIEISTGSAAAKRRLRLELAGAQGPADAAREVGKRLASIAKARSHISWQNRKDLVTDLQSQWRAIQEQIAPALPGEALALTWRFLQLANSVFDRCDDSSGVVIAVFHEARDGLEAIARAAEPPPRLLADAVLDAMRDNGYGQYDGLIGLLAEALGAEGLAELKARVEGLVPVAVPPKREWQVVGYGSGGAVYAHQMEENIRQRLVASALKEIADATGDVDAYIAQYEPETCRVPRIAAGIAARLLSAGRAAEALTYLDQAEFRRGGPVPEEWQAARLAVLEGLGRVADAQAFRLECFHRDLNPEALRAHLKRLADFEDIEAEEAAMAYAAAYPNVLAGLEFLVQWPAMERAASLVQRRVAELDGDRYDILTPAAEALAPRHPMAAMLCLRAMIDFTLRAARSTRYAHAARHLVECQALAPFVAEYGGVEGHAAYLARLKRDHGRKAGFWGLFTA